jgi:hypothetical protein
MMPQLQRWHSTQKMHTRMLEKDGCVASSFVFRAVSVKVKLARLRRGVVTPNGTSLFEFHFS